MTDPQRVAGVPLAYANVRSPSTQQLLAIKQAIFAVCLFVAAFGFVPGTQILVREGPGILEILIILAGFLSYLGLGLGSLLALLRVRAGKWTTVVCPTFISIEGLVGFLAGSMGYGAREFGRLGFWECYMIYGLPTLWASAFPVVAIFVLTRRESPTLAESQQWR